MDIWQSQFACCTKIISGKPRLPIPLCTTDGSFFLTCLPLYFLASHAGWLVIWIAEEGGSTAQGWVHISVKKTKKKPCTITICLDVMHTSCQYYVICIVAVMVILGVASKLNRWSIGG